MTNDHQPVTPNSDSTKTAQSKQKILKSDEHRPPELKLLQENFIAVYDGPDMLWCEYSLQQSFRKLKSDPSFKDIPLFRDMTLEEYRKLYDLRNEKEVPAYPKSAHWYNSFFSGLNGFAS